MKYSHINILMFCLIGVGGSTNVYADIFNGSPQKLIATHSNKCIDTASPKTTSGSPIMQMTCNNEASQQWKAVATANNEYQIISAGSKMCLDVGGSSKVNGGLVYQSNCIINKANQTWIIKQVSPGIYQIISKNSEKCLNINNASQGDNVQLQQWDCGSGANQLWRTEESSLLKISSPIVINAQSNVTIDNVKISNPSGPCILVKGDSKNITIKNSELGPCKTNFQNPQADLSNVGAGVFVTGGGTNTVTVDNVNIHDTDDAGVTIFYGTNYVVTNNVIRNTGDAAIKAQALSNITIQNNTMNTVRTGVYVAGSQNVKVLKNNLTHIQGRTRANFVQFNKVTGVGNRIMCNIGVQDAYGTFGSLDSIEDDISVYASTGTANDPILVVGNKLKNGGPSKSGGGIMLGDGGGAYVTARDNVVVNTGGYGIAITGGTNMKILNNKIFSINTAITNNAIPVWNWSPTTTTCDYPTVSGNQVNWTNTWGPDVKLWVDNSCKNPAFSANTFKDQSITAEIFNTYNSAECK